MPDEIKPTAPEAAGSTSDPSTEDAHTYIFGVLTVIFVLFVSFHSGDGSWQRIRFLLAGVLFIPTCMAGLLTIGLIRAILFSKPKDMLELMMNCGVSVLGFFGTLTLLGLSLWIGGEKFLESLGELVEKLGRAAS